MNLRTALRTTLLTVPVGLLLAACGMSGDGRVDQVEANTLGALATSSNGYLAANLNDPTGFGTAGLQTTASGRALPRPIANLLGLASDGLSAQQASATCVEEVSTGNDVDGDTIPDSASYSIDCTFEENGATATVSGSASATDKDDNDPDSGYTIEVTDFRASWTGPGGNTWSMTMSQSFDLDRTNGDYAIAYAFDLSGDAPGESGSIDRDVDVVYTPDDALDPFAAGTFDATGTLTLRAGGDVFSFVEETTPTLHYDATCADEVDAGSARYSDNRGNTVTVEIASCGTYTVTWEHQETTVTALR